MITDVGQACWYPNGTIMCPYGLQTTDYTEQTRRLVGGTHIQDLFKDLGNLNQPQLSWVW
jgi:hypothetical protein